MYYSLDSPGHPVEMRRGRDSDGASDASCDPDASGDTADQTSVEVSEAAERVRLIDEIRQLEELKSTIAAAQAGAAAAFDASTRRAQARAGLAPEQLGRGVGAQIGLARRESPHRGNRLLGLARILTTEMPCTLQALRAGVISEWRATLLVRETACLSREDRVRVDELVAGDLEGLEGLGDRGLVARVRSVAYGLDPQSVVNRAAKAVEGRYVSCRPAPDTMTYLTGLLPVTQGVGVFAALSREADRLRAAGDVRGRGQIMADTLVERVTGQVRAEDVRVEVQLVMTDRALLAGILPGLSAGDLARAEPVAGAGRRAGSLDGLVPEGSEPAVLAGYGVVPAQWVRDLIRGSRPDGGPDPADTEPNSQGARSDSLGTGPGSGAPSATTAASGWAAPWGIPPVRPDPRTEVWLRRLYMVPETGQLVGMDSRARLVPKGLARFIAARDQTCRMPWCGAPIRHYDHVVPVREGGRTAVENIQGLCEACNQAKEAPGWTARNARSEDDIPLAAKEDVSVLKPPDVPPNDSGTRLHNSPDTGPGNPAPHKNQAGKRPYSGGRHTVLTTTPTGHVYRSIAPCPPNRE